MTMTSHIETTLTPIPTARRTLSEIVATMLDALDDADGEVTPAVDALELELGDKVQGYRAVMLQLAGEQAAFEKLAEDYTARAKTRENTIVGLKFRLDAALKALGVDKLRTPTCTVYYQASKRVEVEDEAGFLDFAEDRFVTTKRYPNRAAIKDALDAGEVVDGASLAESKHLRFK
jgi:hypothetical protein